MTSTIDPVDAVETTDGFDAATTTVRPRELLPTPREVEAGAAAADYEFVRPVEDGPRQSAGDAIRSYARQVDPRKIDGPRRPLVIFGIIALLGTWDDVAVGVIFPELRADFAFNVAFFAAFDTATAVVATFVGPLVGWVADRVKRVWVVRAGVLMANLSSVMLAVAGSFGAFLGSRGVLLIGQVVTEPGQGPLMADYYRPTSRFRAFAFLAAIGSFGYAVGPLLAGFVAERAHWRVTVSIFATLAVAAAVGTLFLREPQRGYGERIEAGATEEEASEDVKEDAPSFAEAFRAGYGIRTLRKMWFAALFTGAVQSANVFVFIYFAGAGLGPQQRGYVLSAGGLVAFLFLPFAGVIGDRLVRVNPGRIMVLLGGIFFVEAAAYVAIGLSPSPILAAALFVPAAALNFLVVPTTRVVASLIIPPNMRGIGMQTHQPFALAGRFVSGGIIIFIPPLIGGIAYSPNQATLVAIAVPLFIAGCIMASGSGSVARDIRAARAVALAGDEAEQARLRGRSKMLICRDVDVTYDGVQVLFGVDFDVEEGDLVALLGTNGAGKSTLMRAICGIQRASNGAIFLDGIDITQEPPHLNATRGIVMVPGGHAIFPTLTVEENLRTAAWIHQADEQYIAERTEEVLQLFPVLRDRLHESAGNMSGGEQQMLAIGQALLMKPRLLMIDELSLGLAPAVVEVLLDTIRRIHAAGTTIVLIEQSINVAVTIAKRAVFMEKGEIRFDGPTTELMRRPELIRAVFMGGAATGGPLNRTADHRRAGELANERLLAVEDVSVAFGGLRALDHATLHVGAEEIVGIIGPNGAGKTTLFDIISGFTKPDAGSVVLGGVDVTPFGPEPRARLGLGRSFQSARLFPSLTVRENVAVAMERMVKVKNPLMTAVWAPKVRQNERLISRRVDALIDMLGLGAYADKFVNELSTGTRRSVDIACIMASAPKMLLLDEPSSGLAQAETEALGPVLERVARDAGCGMLVIEHDIGLVSSISHRLYAMELGAVVASGPPDEVVRDPRVVSSYLAATEDVLVRSDLNRLMLDPQDPSNASTEETRDGHVR